MAPAYAVPRMLERNGLTLQDFDLYEIHEAFAAQVLCTLKAWEDPVFCKERLGLDAAARLDRPRQDQRQRRLARGRPPVRRDRRPDRRRPREEAHRARRRPRPDLDLRRRRPGRRRDPRGLEQAGARMADDRYSQLVNNPVGGFVAKTVGLPQPVELDRYEPGAAGDRRPVLLGAAPGGRLGRLDRRVLALAEADVDTPLGGRGPRRRRRRRPRRRHLEPRGAEPTAIQGARLRRHRDRRLDRAARALGVLPPDDPPRAAVRPRDRPRHAARGVRLAARGDRAARARGLRRARSARRSARGADRPARLRRARRRGPDRFDAALLALAALGLRLRPGRPHRPPLATVTRRSTGSGRSPARSRSSPAPRAASARRSPATLARDGAHVVGLDIPPLADDLDAADRRDRRLVDRRRHHRPRRAGADRRPRSRPSTAASTSSSTTPASPRTRRSVGMDEERWTS